MEVLSATQQGITMHLNVTNADEWYERAVGAGCKEDMPIADTFWNARYGVVVDPYGITWAMMHDLPVPAATQA